MMRARAGSLGLLLALAVVAGAGCPGSEHPDAGGAVASGSAAPAGEPRRGGELVVAVQADALGLDPHVANDAIGQRMIENVYATLLRYGDYNQLLPDLAERWEVSDDGLRVTLHLRSGARFHTSGREVLAQDVKYSLERIVEQKVRAAQLEAVERIETPDERTVVLHLARPFAPLLTYLAHPMNAIVDREVVEAHDGALDREDAGCGPFRIREWKKDRHLTLERDPRYFVQGLPRLDRVVFRPIADETARTTALRTGEVDVVLQVPAPDVAVLEAADGVVVRSVPGTFWEYVGLNVRRPPFDDARVRQAVAWAIDRGALAEVVKLGGATPLPGGHIPQNHWAHAGGLSVYPARDLQKARALLAEAGHEDGLDVTLKVGSSFAYQVAAAQVVKQQLREAGIRVELEALESAVFFDSLGKGDFDMTLVGWVGFVDPDEWTYELFHSGGRWNQQGFASPEVDALLERGRRERGREARAATYAEVQRAVTEAAPMVFLYVNDRVAAWRDRVRGFEAHPTTTTLSLRECWVAR